MMMIKRSKKNIVDINLKRKKKRKGKNIKNINLREMKKREKITKEIN